ncbi:50S ribosomal protein L29 [Promethearchaeum syntrophicum]|uniref:Large ribosomal subunit protein uL29 n=1 Tax=Promethearchaeum syntrophicum TaxID=2594042 RepID=A0A5B9D864_9ARCH|nr:50S ribosomal protein L29 [Candidatus Prometheoarchaeum syntrophicum]QEE15359.1 50S ribosomal protein L29P [Candidatus Prometheoarchaeum syntrophicum]
MKNKMKDIENMSAIEREKKLVDLRNELFKIRASNSMGGTMTDPSKIKQLKKSVARILTYMHEINEI